MEPQHQSQKTHSDGPLQHERSAPLLAAQQAIANSFTDHPMYPPDPQLKVPIAPAPAPNPTVSHTNPGLIVLQWLTYAFWGWTVLGVSILIATVLANLIAQSETGGFTPYGIAAVLVLLPISIVCDVLYGKKEQRKITGPAAIVMVIHAVLFALLGIGALIAAVVGFVSMLTGNDSTAEGGKVALFSGLIIAVLYAAAFLRTINPRKFPFIKRFFVIFMTAVVGIIAILGIVGPVANERATRNDRLVVRHLPTVGYRINDYARNNKKLPQSLNDLKLTGEVKTLLEKNLVGYKPNTKAATQLSTIRNTINTAGFVHYYELCVTYARESADRNRGGYYYDNGLLATEDEHVISIRTYDHPAGEVCYKLKTDNY